MVEAVLEGQQVAMTTLLKVQMELLERQEHLMVVQVVLVQEALVLLALQLQQQVQRQELAVVAVVVAVLQLT
jgi:hypothetical protein